jgi:hypothetical protein
MYINNRIFCVIGTNFILQKANLLEQKLNLIPKIAIPGSAGAVTGDSHLIDWQGWSGGINICKCSTETHLILHVVHFIS